MRRLPGPRGSVSPLEDWLTLRTGLHAKPFLRRVYIVRAQNTTQAACADSVSLETHQSGGSRWPLILIDVG